eukprot:m.4341 g.4341  ORF g.4341 m.4341 type:complete len:398 (+) comp2215_c0_seq1:101-1294(+)
MDDSWIATQTSTFTNWVNVQLKKGNVDKVENDGIVDAFRNGVALNQMLEVVSGKKLRFNKNPRLKVQKLENISTALNCIKEEGLTLVNIGPGDIEGGNSKLVLGLLWTIIYHYQIAASLKIKSSVNAKKGGAKDLLLEWVREQIPEYDIKNFNTNWQDGRALCALTNKIAGEPWVIPNHKEMLPSTAKRNAQAAIDAAERYLNVPQILEADDVPTVDDLSIMTYVSLLKTAKRVSEDGSNAADDDTTAVEEVVEEVVEEAADEEDNTNNNKDDGAEKKVSLPPPWERSLDWRVYEGKDLGGRCKIRVYSSSTTSSAVTRKNNEEMQRLFERLKVHERPDFEPWVMVDLMSKPERDAVFEKAGARVLPMLFVDDEFVGSHDKVMELNETNDLIKILEY